MNGNEDEAENKRRQNRVFTQRYDIHALRKVQTIEDEYRQKVATIIGCEELDIPVEIDVLEIYNKEVSERKIALEQLFQKIPEKNFATVIEDLLQELSTLVLTPNTK